MTHRLWTVQVTNSTKQGPFDLARNYFNLLKGDIPVDQNDERLLAEYTKEQLLAVIAVLEFSKEDSHQHNRRDF